MSRDDYGVICRLCWASTTRAQAYHMADNSFRCESCMAKEIAKRDAELSAMKGWRPK